MISISAAFISRGGQDGGGVTVDEPKSTFQEFPVRGKKQLF